MTLPKASLRSFTDFVLHSRVRAFGVTFALTLIPVVGTLSIILAGMVTLRKGTLEGLWIVIAATLPYFMLLPLQTMPMGLWVVSIIATSNILTWIFAVLLKRYHSWSLVIEIAALIGIFFVASAHIVKPDLENWWGRQLNTYLTELPTASNGNSFLKAATSGAAAADSSQQETNSEANNEPEIISFIAMAKPFATGAVAASLLFTALLQLLASRWWQTAVFAPKKVSHELRNIHLSQVAGLVFLAAMVMSYLHNPLALDMLPVLYLAFFVTGLSLVHYAFGKIKTLPWLWLVLFYGTLVYSWELLGSPAAFVLVAMAALLDIWFDLRERLNRRFP